MIDFILDLAVVTERNVSPAELRGEQEAEASEGRKARKKPAKSAAKAKKSAAKPKSGAKAKSGGKAKKAKAASKKKAEAD